jgi:hypothetical protein
MKLVKLEFHPDRWPSADYVLVNPEAVASIEPLFDDSVRPNGSCVYMQGGAGHWVKYAPGQVAEILGAKS